MEATSVYLYRDARGVLLYVGITSQGPRRQNQHAGNTEWWKYVATQDVEHYGSRHDAKVRESILIREERPPFNRQENPGWPETRHAYLTLFDRKALMRDPEQIQGSRSVKHASAYIAAASKRHIENGCDDEDCLWRHVQREGCFPGCPMCHLAGHAFDSGMSAGESDQQSRLPLAIALMRHRGGPAVDEAATALVEAADAAVAAAVEADMRFEAERLRQAFEIRSEHDVLGLLAVVPPYAEA